MPIPKRKSGEKRDDFIGRCLSNPTMKSEFPDSRQRAAICYQQMSLYKEKDNPLDNIYNRVKK